VAAPCSRDVRTNSISAVTAAFRWKSRVYSGPIQHAS
jgi:hypothetical protein